MKLSERLINGKPKAGVAANGLPGSPLDRDKYYALKSRVHFRLVQLLDLATVAELPRESLATAIREALQELTEKERLPLNRQERSMLISDLMDEIMGLGPIEGLMADNSIQDILINGYGQVYIERSGILHRTPIQFRDNDHLMQIVDKIVSAVGRRIDESSPMVDARLPDGSRVNVIIPPLALNGPVISIRKFGQTPISREDLIRNQAMTPEMLAFLKAAIHAKLNILISGGTGAGKTTLLNALSGFIPASERIVTIEDSAELRLHQPHVVSLESRPPNVEGRGEVTLTDLVKNSLRMRPDRIIVGEARGAEVMDMLQAMNTGHSGSMSTIHANSPQDALSRMEVMASMGTAFFSEQALRRLIASAIHLIVQLARLPDGHRRVMSISEVRGFDAGQATLQDIFTFTQQGVDAEGRIYGEFRGCGTAPDCMDHLRSYGQELDTADFHSKLTVK
jgi:pilus assembly protein CpaF